MWKKGTVSLLFAMMWLCLTGFAGLGNEGEDTLNALLDQLSVEDVQELLEDEEWRGKVMAKVEDSVSIRAEASKDSEVLGKLYKGCAGSILEEADGWTKIESGKVTGWVSNDYLAFGEEAKERAAQDVSKMATVMTQTLKVRDEASTEADVIDLIGLGEKIEVGQELDGWLEIIYSDGEVDYISAEYVEVSYEYGEAKTMEEIAAEEARRKAEEEKAE